MAKIYLPTEFLNKPCYQINNGYIRVFDSTRYNQQNVVYDVYVNQNYQVKQSYSNFSSSTQCDAFNTFTDDVYYRNDFDKILVIFVILVLVIFIFPYSILSRLWRKRRFF